jgi:hypothetical protein
MIGLEQQTFIARPTSGVVPYDRWRVNNRDLFHSDWNRD